MAERFRWSRKADLFLMRNRDRSWVWCAGKLGCSPNAARCRARKLKVQHRTNHADPAAILRLTEAGLTTTQIGAELGIHAETVRYHLKAMGRSAAKRCERKRMRTYRANMMLKYGVNNPGELSARKQAQKAASLGWPGVPFHAALTLESLRRLGVSSNKHEITAERVTLALSRGWSRCGRGTFNTLNSLKWLLDRGFVSASGKGSSLRFYSLTQEASWEPC